MNTEVWKEIDNHPEYMINNNGNIKSMKLNKVKIIKPILINGYYKVNLSTNGIVYSNYIHLILAKSFLNYIPIKGLNIDHIDGNKLNNNISNLRIVTIRENASKDRKSNTKLVGVHWKEKAKKWCSQIYINKKQIHLGYFNCPIEAKKAYDNALNNLI